jgi:uncharacterized protein (DUF58 family)
VTLAPDLRARAEALGQTLPPLLAAAEHLAATVTLGEHGRRRPGMGDDFWQYRPARAGDALRLIDWRRSARSDQAFVQEREWQAAQSVVLWVDPAQSMDFAGSSRPPKSDHARLLAMALAVLLLRAGEQVGLAGHPQPPRAGKGQILRLVEALAADLSAPAQDYAAALPLDFVRQGRAVFISDFLGDLSGLERSLSQAAASGVKGLLLQVLDPDEEAFPYDGRTVFVSMGGSLAHETKSAGDLRGRYLARLAERKARLAELAQAAGWVYASHHTGQSATPALLWAYRALQGGW